MQAAVSDLRYADFGDRFMASVIDSIVQLPLILPLLWFLLRADIMGFTGDPLLLAEQISASLETPLARAVLYGIPLLYCVLFWKYRSATPGKIMLDMKIVDATTGGKPTTGRLLLRYLGYVISVLTLGLAFLWIAFDKRRQGLHDKMANTVVILTSPAPPANAGA
jgi:uncharacterized RDD family membrane protein YckC